MKTVQHNGHRIQVQVWGREKVLYDGAEVCSSFHFFVQNFTHVFSVNEDGEHVQYEVEFRGFWGPWIKIRRNGIVIYSDK